MEGVPDPSPPIIPPMYKVHFSPSALFIIRFDQFSVPNGDNREDCLSLIRFLLTLRFPDVWNIGVNGKLTKCKEIESHLSKMLFPANF